MKAPRKAFILAAGLGTRLRPLTHHTPKPLVPVWGKPALLLTLRRLKAWGVQEVLINVHSHLDAFRHFANSSGPLKLRIEFSYEPVVLDTGGALRRAAWFLDNDPFWLVNGDIVFDFNPRPLLSAFNTKAPPLAALWCSDQFGPRTVELKGNRVSNFRSATPGAAGTFTFCGIHLLSPRILSFIPPAETYSIITAYQQAMKAGEPIAGVSIPRHYWADIGTVDAYINAHRDLAAAYQHKTVGADLVDPATWKHSQSLIKIGIKTQGVVAVSPMAHVEKGAALNDSIVWAHSRIAANATCENAIVAGCIVAGPSVASGAILTMAQTPSLLSLTTALVSCGFFESSTVIPFPPRGSARSFYRLLQGGRSAVLIRYELSRPENALHAGHTRFLQAAGIRVPRLLAENPADRWCLMEDCGDRSLLEAVKKASTTSRMKLYQAVLNGVADWHSARVRGACLDNSIQLAPAFTPALYRWEHALFIQHFVEPRLDNAAGIISAIRRELGRVAAQLVKQPSVLLHRDLQSTNVLFKNQQPVFIDFQGMRLGPAVYDLASLLSDPYVSLPEAEQQHLLVYYARRARRPLSDLKPLFTVATIQRLCQALGAYGRLSALGLSSFEAYIRPALILLDRALDKADNTAVLRGFVKRCLASGSQKG